MALQKENCGAGNTQRWAFRGGTYVYFGVDAAEHPRLPLPSLQWEQMESQHLTGSDALVESAA